MLERFLHVVIEIVYERPPPVVTKYVCIPGYWQACFSVRFIGERLGAEDVLHVQECAQSCLPPPRTNTYIGTHARTHAHTHTHTDSHSHTHI